MPLQNAIPFIVTLLLALAWLQLNRFAARRGWVDSSLSRKIIHIGTGPIFVLCWLLFYNTPDARYIAAVIPALITLQFILVGVGLLKDKATVNSMARHGSPGELLRGPLLYGIAFVALTIAFWYNSPTGIVALMILCGGDGLADIVGRKIGGPRIPWNKDKTFSGSLAMFLGGLILAAAVVGVFVLAEKFNQPFAGYYLPRIALIAAVCTLIESLPLPDMDNLTVPAAAGIMGLAMFSFA